MWRYTPYLWSVKIFSRRVAAPACAPRDVSVTVGINQCIYIERMLCDCSQRCTELYALLVQVCAVMLCANNAITGPTSFHKCATCFNYWSSQCLHSSDDAGDVSFSAVTQRGLVVEGGTERLPETLVNNYEPTLCNITEERRYHLHRGGSLKSREMISHSIYTVWSHWW